MGAPTDDPSPAAWTMREIRKRLRAASPPLCVNGASHGPAAPGRGGRCTDCADRRNKARRVNPDPVVQPA